MCFRCIFLRPHMRVDSTLVGLPSCEGEEACNRNRVFFFQILRVNIYAKTRVIRTITLG